MYQHSFWVLLFLSSVALSSAEDNIIFKAYPANLPCNRNATIRNLERNAIRSKTGRTTL